MLLFKVHFLINAVINIIQCCLYQEHDSYNRAGMLQYT